jgi:hypothetical protein
LFRTERSVAVQKTRTRTIKAGYGRNSPGKFAPDPKEIKVQMSASGHDDPA